MFPRTFPFHTMSPESVFPARGMSPLCRRDCHLIQRTGEADALLLRRHRLTAHFHHGLAVIIMDLICYVSTHIAH